MKTPCKIHLPILVLLGITGIVSSAFATGVRDDAIQDARTNHSQATCASIQNDGDHVTARCALSTDGGKSHVDFAADFPQGACHSGRCDMSKASNVQIWSVNNRKLANYCEFQLETTRHQRLSYRLNPGQKKTINRSDIVQLQNKAYRGVTFWLQDPIHMPRGATPSAISAAVAHARHYLTLPPYEYQPVWLNKGTSKQHPSVIEAKCADAQKPQTASGGHPVSTSAFSHGPSVPKPAPAWKSNTANRWTH